MYRMMLQLTEPLGQGHTCNFKVYVIHVLKIETDKIILIYLTQNIISIINIKEFLMRKFTFFFVLGHLNLVCILHIQYISAQDMHGLHA